MHQTATQAFHLPVVQTSAGLAAENPRALSWMVACSQDSVIGDVVSATPLGVVGKSDSSLSSKMPAVGVLAWVSTGDALLVCDGLVVDVYHDLTPGAVYYVGIDGRPVTLATLKTTGAVFCQRLGFALTVNSLLVSLGARIVRL